MRYVIKNSEGNYLCGTRGRTFWGPYIDRARVFGRRSDAAQAIPKVYHNTLQMFIPDRAGKQIVPVVLQEF